MITMEPKIQSTTSTRALRSKIGPIKAYLFKASYVISPITPSDLKHSMKGAYKSFLSKTDQAYGHSTSTINPKLYPISTFKQMSLVVVPSFICLKVEIGSGDSSYRLSTYPPFDEGTSA